MGGRSCVGFYRAKRRIIVYYNYYMCRKCKNKLIEKIQMEDSDTQYFETEEKCEKCGGKLKLVLTGEDRLDDTTYKLYCGTPVIAEKDKCVRGIMGVCNCSIEEARQKLSIGYNYLSEKEVPSEALLSEGNIFQTYLNMEILDQAGMTYHVKPEFPLKRRQYIDCPGCGSETVYKMERTEKSEDAADYMKHGWFCETCGEWVSFCYFSKMDLDDTDYKLEFSLQKFRTKAKENAKVMFERFLDKKVLQDKAIIYDKARNIHPLLQELKEMDINYEIVPSYPYKVVNYSDEELLNMVLKLNKS